MSHDKPTSNQSTTPGNPLQEKAQSKHTSPNQMSSSSTATPQLELQSALMKGYHRSTPISVGKQIVATPGADGQVQVFAIGSKGEVNNIYPDPKSETGWNLVNLQLPVAATTLTATTDTDGTIIVLVGGIDGNLYCLRHQRRQTS